MARKGSRQANIFDRKAHKHRIVVPESVDSSVSENKENKADKDDGKFTNFYQSNGDSLFMSGNPVDMEAKHRGDAGVTRSYNQRNLEVLSREKSTNKIQNSVQADMSGKVEGNSDIDLLSDVFKSTETDKVMLHDDCSNNGNRLFGGSSIVSVATVVELLDSFASWSFRSASYLLETAGGWIDQQKPRVSLFITYMHRTYACCTGYVKSAYPVIQRWILRIGKLVLLLAVMWLDCTVQGLKSLLHLGTTSLFAVLWCSFLSIVAMIGIIKVLISMVIAVLLLMFVGFVPALLMLAIPAIIVLWLYGSFWTTSLVTFVGGVTYGLRLERVALFVTTLYSMYCATSYLGWPGLLLGLNLSFMSNVVLIQVLRKNVHDHSSDIPQEEKSYSEAGADDNFRSYFSPSDGTYNPSSKGVADRGCQVPSTSGRETEATSEDEVNRLLNCSDHYTALGFNRYENVDVSLLKKEYRKKAMLVHPDKNMGNEKAAEAFKKLQNAYEILLDSLKRKNYDDDLRREELLNYFRRFQTSSQKECKDFHQAKDGDGWLEQTLQPFLFGLIQKDALRSHLSSVSSSDTAGFAL
ncbi:Chaperone protein dnaJ 49 [Apostasia shenzhenica]|uniref:Chaperone protein dnaJ 49 n=1 Tax=Apostasia shenzhenica TaxID=1088818 RepID=A0A2I0BD31_9ASPA|nr:Chaperone protein dnaJ 49 [Apostasia shenzhenica]